MHSEPSELAQTIQFRRLRFRDACDIMIDVARMNRTINIDISKPTKFRLAQKAIEDDETEKPKCNDALSI